MPRHRAALVAPIPAWAFIVAALSSCATGAGGGGDGTKAFVTSTSLPASQIEHVAVVTEGKGSLLLQGGDADTLEVSYVQSGPELLQNQVETIDKGDTMVVGIHPTKGSSIDLRVSMPERVTLALEDEAREVVVNNIENRVDVLMHAGGSLQFDDIEGPLTIVDGGGPIRLHDVRGPIEIRDESGLVDIHEVTNSVKIESQRGDVTLDNVGGDVTLTVGPGDLSVTNVTGKLAYRKTGSGRVRIENVAGGVEKL